MTTASLNNVSIRLMSGGHTFSVSDIDASVRAAKMPVEVVVITPKTTLVPEEMFVEDHAADYLAEVGLRPSFDECVVYSRAECGVVAVMAISRKCYDALNETLTMGVNYTSPLMFELGMTQGCLLHLEGDTLYIRVHNQGMLLAEAVECLSDADILYYVANVNAVYGIYNMHARAKGDARRLLSVCRGLFKNLEICE